MRNDELLEASEDSSGDLHERDTIPVPKPAMAQPSPTGEFVALDAQWLELESADDDDSPTLRPPPMPIGNLKLEIPVPLEKPRAGAWREPTAFSADTEDGDVREVDASEVSLISDSAETQRYVLGEPALHEVRIPPLPLPAEFARKVSHTKPRGAAEIKAVESPPLVVASRQPDKAPDEALEFGLAPWLADNTSLAPTVRRKPAEPARSSRKAVLLTLAVIVPVGVAALSVAITRRTLPREAQVSVAATAQPRVEVAREAPPHQRRERTPRHAGTTQGAESARRLQAGARNFTSALTCVRSAAERGSAYPRTPEWASSGPSVCCAASGR